MNQTIKKGIFVVIGLFTIGTFFISCKKSSFENTGKHEAVFNGTVMDYINSKPDYFKMLSDVIKVAGMENSLKNEDITFFAPADSSIRRSIIEVNSVLVFLGLKPVTQVNQIKPEIWRKYLARYTFKGKKSMNDYPQLDPGNLSAYAGQIYASYDGSLMNIGVIYNDAGSVKYAGYRELAISYISSASTPKDYTTWWSAKVASVNIKPSNGYVHVLSFSGHYFGFNLIDFIDDVVNGGTTIN